MNKKPEIMSPAGDKICLLAAIDAGCDAVYFGVEGMNMRAGAKNFTCDDLPEITKLCHDNDVKAYLAMNTIVYEGELELISDILDKAKDAGVDAVICWDFAVIEEAKRKDIPLFLSTQMSVANSSSISFFYNNVGIKRFVLARECSIDDVNAIKRDLETLLLQEADEIELEAFVHGAMCVSVSGRCFMSQFQAGKSANRGECIQHCRREYIVTDPDDDQSLAVGNNYVLSPKDMCTLPIIEKLIESGLNSFKIEGRNRNPEYVMTVTAAYRKAVDYYYDHIGDEGFKEDFERLKEELIGDVERVYNRGFSTGFYMGKPIDEWAGIHGSAATAKKMYSGIVTNFYKKNGVAEIRVQDNSFVIGDEIMFHGEGTGVLAQSVDSIEVEHEKVESADKGMLVAVKTEGVVRRNDKVFVVKESV